jgi:6-phosphogluconate dehydrogenase
MADMVAKLEPPRTIWIMVPAGGPTQNTVDELAGLLQEGDTIVDGGNSKWTDDKLRADQLAPKGITTSTWAPRAASGGSRSATA